MMELPTDELLDYLVSDAYLDAQRQQERNRDQPPAPLVEPATLERALIRAALDPAETAGLESALAAVHDGIRILTTPTRLYGVAALDELLAAAATPTRRRRWWWPW